MKRIIYRSQSYLQPNDARILDLMRSCDRNNHILGITGRLYFDKTHFLQAIEGASESVDRLFSKIRSDKRHGSIFILQDCSIVRRSYDKFEILYDQIAKDGAFPSAELEPTASQTDTLAIGATHAVFGT